MTMDRRGFIKHMALIAAGMAARPEQIAAFETYYEANTPDTTLPLASVDEIWISGEAKQSLALRAVFSWGHDQQMDLSFNAYGGIFRWVAAPDAKIIAPLDEFRWQIERLHGNHDGRLEDQYSGQVSYIDQNAKRHYVKIANRQLVAIAGGGNGPRGPDREDHQG